MVAFYLCLALIKQARADDIRECIAYVDNHPFTDIVSHPEANKDSYKVSIRAPLYRSRVNDYCKCMANRRLDKGYIIELDSFECAAITRLFNLIDV